MFKHLLAFFELWEFAQFTAVWSFILCMCRFVLSWRLKETLRRFQKLFLSVAPSSLVLGPTNSSSLLSPISNLYLLNLVRPPCFEFSLPCVVISKLPRDQNWGNCKAHFVFFLSKISFSLSVVPVSETVVSYLLSRFLVVYGGRASSIPVTSPWSEVGFSIYSVESSGPCILI